MQDNLATIYMVSNEQVNFKGHSKFISIKHFCVCQFVEDGTIKLVHVATDKNIADYLTKHLASETLMRFRIALPGSLDI